LDTPQENESMEPTNYMDDKHLPEWTEDTGLRFWEPDPLIVEWFTFLYTIWHRVDYL
jgi:hypothetical protein